MPFTHVSMRPGKPPAYRRAILDQLYEAMRETFDVPEDDRFMALHETEDFVFGRRYLDIARGDDLVMIQITASNTRDLATKKALYKRIVERLADEPGLRPEDVFINLVETLPDNWSFGHGLAQKAREA